MGKIEDLTGQRFGRLVARSDSGERSAGRSVLWLCTCDCGSTCKVNTGNLKSGHTKSCGCLARECKPALGRSRLKDLTGQRFGRLVVLRDSGGRSTGGSVLWLCNCDCGNTCKVQAGRLKTGNTKSCGCLPSRRPVDLTGQRFGRLVVLKDSRERPLGKVVWLCACDCGNIRKVNAGNLKSGHTKSCGCGRRCAKLAQK